MFSGKLALVTGGGDGIGAMLARVFAGWVLWPHVEAMLLAGGGLMTCATEPGQLDIMRDRYAQLCASIVES